MRRMRHIIHALFIAKHEEARTIEPEQGPFRVFPTLPAPWCDQQALAQIVVEVKQCTLREALNSLKISLSSPDDAEPFWRVYEVPSDVTRRVSELDFNQVLSLGRSISELQWNFAASPDRAATIMRQFQGFCRIALDTACDLYLFENFNFMEPRRN